MKKILLFSIILNILISCGGSSADDSLVIIKTEYGDMTVLLYEETPLHKANFIELAKKGKYDSTVFHRVMKNFMIQGGDIFRNSEDVEKETDKIPAELNDSYLHTRGSLAAARQNDQVNPEKKSSSCQFYIVDGLPWSTMSIDQRTLNQKITEMLQDTALLMNDSSIVTLRDQFIELQTQRDFYAMNDLAIESRSLVEEIYNLDLTIEPKTKNNAAYQAAGGGAAFLDGSYTVFGRVVEGLDVIDKITAIAVKPNAQGEMSDPINPPAITMEVISMSKKEITEKYGYNYPN